jgi:hypothetical protein
MCLCIYLVEHADLVAFLEGIALFYTEIVYPNKPGAIFEP